MNELTVHLLVAMAQHEQLLISQQRGEQILGSGDPTNATKAHTSKADDFAKGMAEAIADPQS